ncbi:MAG TPA: S1 RNA-binding domain-containing protein, partial [Firmicutes bacterium]|nr:S1 RNA-binding domain-containing protein [Bacillota bacterium]
KIQGLTREILERGLNQAKEGRIHILSKMKETISSPRTELSEYAPKILIMNIPKDRIGEVIGPAGKVIKEISLKTEAKIFIDDDGKIKISGPSLASVNNAQFMIKSIIEGVIVGETYEGVVERIESYGCFVSIAPGVVALVHISELEYGRTERVEDIVKMGEKVNIKIIDIDQMGRVKASRKALLPKPEGSDFQKEKKFDNKPYRKDGYKK